MRHNDKENRVFETVKNAKHIKDKSIHGGDFARIEGNIVYSQIKHEVRR